MCIRCYHTQRYRYKRHMECKHTRLDASGEHFVAFALSPIADAVHQPGEFADYRTA